MLLAPLARRLLSSTSRAPPAAAPMASLFKLKATETVELVPGHLKKEIVMPGQGGTPTKGCTVTAHYTGKLTDGSEFDSSRARGKPFQFKIGLGQVIQGWDVGTPEQTRHRPPPTAHCPPPTAHRPPPPTTLALTSLSISADPCAPNPSQVGMATMSMCP